MTSSDCEKQKAKEKLYHGNFKGPQAKLKSVDVGCDNIKNFMNTSGVKVIIGAYATFYPGLNTMANTFGKLSDAHAYARPFVRT